MAGKNHHGDLVLTDQVVIRLVAEPAGYGLGRAGWVHLTLPSRVGRAHWDQLEEWIETSYRLVAPKRLVKQLDTPG